MTKQMTDERYDLFTAGLVMGRALIKEEDMFKDNPMLEHIMADIEELYEALGVERDRNKELEALVEEMDADVKFLRCLEGAGVDNWDGYDFAQEAFQEKD